MRDVFWGGMPLLFLALSYLKHMPRWPARLLGAVFLLQAPAMVHAGSYAFTSFSPAGSWMLAHLPAPANPEPEIFAERALHFNGALRLDSVVRYRAGDADKLLFNANGPFQCVERPDPIAVLPGAFGNPESLIRLEGWSMLELRGGVWNGMWTDGPRARMLIPSTWPARRRSPCRRCGRASAATRSSSSRRCRRRRRDRKTAAWVSSCARSGCAEPARPSGVSPPAWPGAPARPGPRP
jgi:hypothetical protein